MVTEKFAIKHLHPMLTRTRTRHLPPPKNLSYILEVVIKEPVSVTKVLNNSTWYKAMEIKYEALIGNQTWELVPPNSDQNSVEHK